MSERTGSRTELGRSPETGPDLLLGSMRTRRYRTIESNRNGARVRTQVKISVKAGPNLYVDAMLFSFSGLCDEGEHIAVVIRRPSGPLPPLVRVHSECLTGDVFGSSRCDCGAQLQESLERIARHGGVIIYLRQEGRGVGLYSKLDAYLLQEAGADTFQANRQLNLPDDARNYKAAAEMLLALNVRRIRLLSNNLDKVWQLEREGITVCERVPTGVFVTPDNIAYLRAKADQAGHLICLPESELSDRTSFTNQRGGLPR